MNLLKSDYINQNDKELVQLFVSSSTTKKYILGINKLTKSVQKHIEVDGIIDDFTRVQRSRKKEVLKIEEVPKDALILWTATGSPLEVKHRLDKMGFKHISYLALCKYSTLDLVHPPFIMDFKEDFAKHREEYDGVYKLLADEKSRSVFEKVINFKISFDYEFMDGFTNNHEGQYFDKEILPEIKNIRFVDGGGYVGDTATEVIKHYPDFSKLYLIEPIPENIRIAKRELGEYENIEFLTCGVSDKKETLYFNEEKSFSTIYGSGTQSVEVDTIDNIVKEKVDYIKLDIEGAEQDAIEGAKETIQKYKPILAICIYHKAEDWYRIPQKVLA
ncbi:MAG: FkbM family methyltransferase, partial [Campylobacterota bacterium]|nr:FkbM family methyltransferase [Campylobacterota bacterium]